jgi:fluoroquinolone resistance protein
MIFEDETFVGKDYQKKSLEKATYENCQFNSCNFGEVNLTGISFVDCHFIDCNFSNAMLNTVSINGAEFKNCKMLGLHFEHCNPFLFSANFTGCQLNLSSFYQVKLKFAQLINCTLVDVDFTEADCTNVKFDGSDLSQAIFDQTNLLKADFRTAENFIINPENNNITKAKFSKHNLLGLLTHFNIDIE